MKKLILIPLLVALLGCVALAQTTSGNASRMTAQQLSKLRATKRHFLVPTYVPAGFKVKRFGLESPKDPVMLSWILTYENPKTKASFTVQMCSDGIGDVFFDLPGGDVVEATGHKDLKSKVLGEASVEEYVKGKHRLWHVNWVELGSKAVPKFIALIGEKMSSAEGKKIVLGLRWLK
jgi:hypothetical protein